MNQPSTSPLVVLGSGYTGQALYAMGTAQGRMVLATSRNPLRHLAEMPSEQRVMFDLEQPSTWMNIPTGADLVWCFPATPLHQVEAVASWLNASARRLVVLGSTSAYEVGESQDYPPLWIDETAPIDLTKPRVQGEEFLRHKYGAIVLRVAGIYGPGRSPLNWIRQGRVGPSRKYVNLIHVEDLAAICLAAIEKGTPGETYNVSDGQPHTWSEICDVAQTRWGITAQGIGKEDQTGKRISNHKLVHSLYLQYRYPDLYTALQTLP